MTPVPFSGPDKISLGEFDLPKGPNRLTVEIVGMNASEKAVAE